jgi:hypothetical protein
MAAFVVGWAILCIAGLVPVLGAVLWFAATWYGLGALVVAAYRARQDRSGPTRLADRSAAAPTPA